MTNTTIHGRFSWLRALIIIVVIIALLWLLFRIYAYNPKEQSRRAKCGSNLKQIALAFKQYALDHDESFPDWDDGTEPYQAFGKLHPSYMSALEAFRCPSSSDVKWDAENAHLHNNKDDVPFTEDACKKSLSYAYSFNKDGSGKGIKGPWPASAPSSLRIAADKYTTHDYTIENYPEHRPLNHQIMQLIFSTDRNILRQGCRIFVRLDGSAEVEKSIKPLEADPSTEYEKSGHPESDQTGADWWSDPPGK